MTMRRIWRPAFPLTKQKYVDSGQSRTLLRKSYPPSVALLFRKKSRPDPRYFPIKGFLEPIPPLHPTLRSVQNYYIAISFVKPQQLNIPPHSDNDRFFLYNNAQIFGFLF